MSTAIIIAGMHRSGTSAATGALQLAGVSLGRGLLEAGADNPKGYFENERAVQIHEALLERLGSSWDDVRQLPIDWEAGSAAREAKDSIRKLIEDEFADKPLWAIKDPRICRFIPLWRSVLEELGMRAVSLLVARRPAEVAASIAARNGWARPLGELLWMRHVFEAEAATRDLPRSVISYDSLLHDPHASLSNALDRLQLQVPLEGQASRNLAGFVDSSHRHHVDAEAPTDPFQSLMEEAYQELVSIENGADDWRRVQEIGTRAGELMSEWVPYVEAVANKAAKHRKDCIDVQTANLHVQSQLNAQIQWSEEAVVRERILHDRLEVSASNASMIASLSDSLRHALDEAGKDREAFASERRLLQEHREAMLVQHAESLDYITRTITLLQEERRHWSDERHGLIQDKQALQERCERLESDLMQQREAALAHQEVLSAKGAQLAADKHELEAKVAELSIQIDHIYRSSSWRVTRPLRAVANFFRS